MKVEFHLNLDKDGNPCICFKHYDRHDSLEQKLLGVFLEAVKEKGCVLKNPSGYLKSGTSDSREDYQIQISK